MMPTTTTSERTEQERTARADEIRQFMSNVFSLQEKVAQVAQMAMTLSAQAAILSGDVQGAAIGATLASGALSAGTLAVGTIEVPPMRVPRGTPAPPPLTDGAGVQEAGPIPTPSANPGQKRKRAPRVTAAQAKPAATAATPNPGPPKSGIELALVSKGPLTTRLLAKATGLAVSAAAASAEALAKEGKVRNIGDPDQPVWMAAPTWPALPWDRSTSDELRDLVMKLLDGRNFSFEQLVSATGAPSGKVDQALTKLKFKDLVTIIEPESGRKLIYTLNHKPNPERAHLKKKRYRS